MSLKKRKASSFENSGVTLLAALSSRSSRVNFQKCLWQCALAVFADLVSLSRLDLFFRALCFRTRSKKLLAKDWISSLVEPCLLACLNSLSLLCSLVQSLSSELYHAFGVSCLSSVSWRPVYNLPNTILSSNVYSIS